MFCFFYSNFLFGFLFNNDCQNITLTITINRDVRVEIMLVERRVEELELRNLL